MFCKTVYLHKDPGDQDRVGEEHAIHGQGEGQPLDGVLQEGAQCLVSQEVHHPEVAGQQLVDMIGVQEARDATPPTPGLLELAHLEAHRPLEEPGS